MTTINPLHLLLLSIILFLPAGVWANVPVPSMFGFMAPGYATIITIGTAFLAIVAIEGAVLKKFCAVSSKQAFKWALVMNLVSSICGIIPGTPCLLLPFFIVLPILGYTVLRQQLGYPIFVIALLFVAPLAWTMLTYNHVMSSWGFWGSLVPGYVLTVLVELLVFFMIRGTATTGKPVIIANAFSYLFLLILFLTLRLGPSDNPLLSPDYFGTVIRTSAQRGDVQRAMEFEEHMRHHYPKSWYAGYSRIRAARAFITQGRLAEARYLLEIVKAQEHWDCCEEMIADDIAETEQLLRDAEGE